MDADQDFYCELLANSQANHLFGNGSILSRKIAEKRSSVQITRWNSGESLAAFIISLKEEENNQCKDDTITRCINDRSRIGFSVWRELYT